MFANRNLLVIVIAAILGIAAVIIANSYLSGVETRQDQAAEQGRLVQIAVARTPMEYGTRLTSENIRMVSWPATSLPAGAFQSLKGLYGQGEPRVALRPIEVGEPILPGKITGPGGRATISALIDPAMRAVAVRINDVAGVAGFVLPGDSVDVLITRQPKLEGESGETEQITDILMQNVRVIAIDQSPSENSTEPRVGKTVTLLVDQPGAQNWHWPDKLVHCRWRCAMPPIRTILRHRLSVPAIWVRAITATAIFLAAGQVPSRPIRSLIPRKHLRQHRVRPQQLLPPDQGDPPIA